MRISRAIAFAAALIATAYLARLAALQTATIPASPVVVDRHFGMILLGIMGFTALLATLMLTKPGQGWLAFNGSLLHKWMIAIGSLLSIVGIAITVVPQIQAPAQTTLVIPPTPTIIVPPIQVNHPVYYDNGQSRLDNGQRRGIAAFFDALTTCEGAEVAIKAFASSASFSKDQDNRKNLDLANDRADGISQIAVGHGIKKLKVTKWETYEAMAKARDVRDVDSNGQRLKIREFLNRRAEIMIAMPAQCIQ